MMTREPKRTRRKAFATLFLVWIFGSLIFAQAYPQGALLAVFAFALIGLVVVIATILRDRAKGQEE
jgi:uncharacterized membrane protein